jgi:hypothetical protein
MAAAHVPHLHQGSVTKGQRLNCCSDLFGSCVLALESGLLDRSTRWGGDCMLRFKRKFIAGEWGEVGGGGITYSQKSRAQLLQLLVMDSRCDRHREQGVQALQASAGYAFALFAFCRL